MSIRRKRSETSRVGDALIDEVRAVRRQVCREFSNDVDRLVDHLQSVEREYAGRRGAFAGVTRKAAAKVVQAWGRESRRTDDPLLDELRAVRKNLAAKRS